MKNAADSPMIIAFEKNFPEAILAAMTVMFGMILVLPPDSLQYAEGYDILAALAPSWVWGSAFLASGVVNLWGVLRRRGDLVRSSSKVLSFMWLGLTFMFGVSAPFAPGWILMLGFGILFAGVSAEYRTKTKWFDGTDELGPDL